MESGTKRKLALVPKDPKGRSKDFMKAEGISDVKKISSAEAILRIKTLVPGWKDEFSKVLKLPPEVFLYNEGNVLVLSKDESLSVMKLLPAMRADADPPKDIRASGLMIYETAGNSYLVFADDQRRVVVRDRLSNFHSGEGNWEKTMKVIGEAVALSETATSPDSLVYVDETRFKKKVL